MKVRQWDSKTVIDVIFLILWSLSIPVSRQSVTSWHRCHGWAYTPIMHHETTPLLYQRCRSRDVSMRGSSSRGHDAWVSTQRGLWDCYRSSDIVPRLHQPHLVWHSYAYDGWRHDRDITPRRYSPHSQRSDHQILWWHHVCVWWVVLLYFVLLAIPLSFSLVERDYFWYWWYCYPKRYSGIRVDAREMTSSQIRRRDPKPW